MKGIQPRSSFTPTAQGSDFDPEKEYEAVSPPAGGGPGAVSLGAGVTTQELNNEMHKSKMFTMGAAHGSVSVAGGWGQNGVSKTVHFKDYRSDNVLGSRSFHRPLWARR